MKYMIGFLSIALLAASVPTAAKSYNSYLILELGNPKDAIVAVKSLHARTATNLTPDDREFDRNMEFKSEYLSRPVARWFPGFDKAPPPDAWLTHWCTKSPSIVYLSGHFAGDLYNNGSGDTRFAVTFDTRGVLKVNSGGSEREFAATALSSECRLVVVMGCSIVGMPTSRDEVQGFFRPEGGERPLLLGFARACPTEKQEKLVERFFEQLPNGKSWTDEQILEAWFGAARAWSEVGEEVRKHVGYVKRDGTAWSPSDDWAPRKLD